MLKCNYRKAFGLIFLFRVDLYYSETYYYYYYYYYYHHHPYLYHYFHYWSTETFCECYRIKSLQFFIEFP
jgi:hypothetical protein